MVPEYKWKCITATEALRESPMSRRHHADCSIQWHPSQTGGGPALCIWDPALQLPSLLDQLRPHLGCKWMCSGWIGFLNELNVFYKWIFFSPESSNVPDFLSKIILSLSGDCQTKTSKDRKRIQVKWTTIFPSSSSPTIKYLKFFLPEATIVQIIMA